MSPSWGGEEGKQNHSPCQTHGRRGAKGGAAVTSILQATEQRLDGGTEPDCSGAQVQTQSHMQPAPQQSELDPRLGETLQWAGTGCWTSFLSITQGFFPQLQ